MLGAAIDLPYAIAPRSGPFSLEDVPSLFTKPRGLAALESVDGPADQTYADDLFHGNAPGKGSFRVALRGREGVGCSIVAGFARRGRGGRASGWRRRGGHWIGPSAAAISPRPRRARRQVEAAALRSAK